MPREPKPIRIQQFLGVVNKPGEFARPMGALDHAKNVDVDDQGALRMRDGYSLTASLTDVQSAYSTVDGQRAFVIDDGDLKEIVDTSGSTVTLASGLEDGQYTWTEAGNRVFYTGADQGEIENGIYKVWGVPTPAQPFVDAADGGSLPGGRYLVTYTYEDTWGREGGAPAAFTIIAPDDSLLRISVDSTSGYTARVYVSSVNGRTLYHVGDTTGDALVFDGPLERLVFPLRDEQIGAEPPPSGEVACYHDERVYLSQYVPNAALSALYWSERWWYHLYRPDRYFAAIPGKIRLMVSLEQGLLIGTDREIHLMTPEGLTDPPLADFGVPEGTSYGYDDQRRACFWTEHGACRALPFEQLTYAQADIHSGVRARGIIIDGDHQRFVAWLEHNEDPQNWVTASS